MKKFEILNQYNNLLSESEKFKELKIKNLSNKYQKIINCVIFNFDISILEIKVKNYEECFKVRNDLISALALFLEE